jgi:Arc/MetJ family transcription regulator
MRTNINLDDDLVREAFKYTGAKTKKELVHIALKELVETHKRLNLLDLAGKIKFVEDYDYKPLREGK